MAYDFNNSTGLNAAAEGTGHLASPKLATIQSILSSGLGLVLSVLGIIFLGLMLYGGLTWMTAAGDDAKIKKARELITAAVIGLIIVVAAYAVTYFVTTSLGGATLK